MNMDDGTYHTIIMDTEGNSIKDLENIYVTFIDYADGKIFSRELIEKMHLYKLYRWMRMVIIS